MAKADYDRRNWQRNVLKRYRTPEMFKHGGDRRSNAFQFATKRMRIDINHKETVVSVTEVEPPLLPQFCVTIRPLDVTPVSKEMHWMCTTCKSNGLDHKIGTVPAYSNVAAKRQVRQMFVAFVRNCGLAAPNLFVIDHFLPFDDTDHTKGSYLCEDLLELPNVTTEQLYSPNIDGNVVSALEALGLAHVRRMCACLFLQRYTHTVRTMGGFTAMMPDVWGGFEHGASHPGATLQDTCGLR